MSMDDIKFKSIFPLEEPRSFQRALIDKIAYAYDNGIVHVIVNAPTGTGKSVVAIAMSNYMKSSYILTSQKLLQDQYVNDFNIAEIRGKANYKCSKNPLLKCDFGECIKSKQEISCPECEYMIARNFAYSSNICILNYSYFFNMAREAPFIQKKRNLLILDECHKAETELLSYTNLKLDKKDFEKFEIENFHVEFPHMSMDSNSKFKWLFTDLKNNLYKTYSRELLKFENMLPDNKMFYKQSRKCKYLDTQHCIICRLEEEYKKTSGIVIQDSTSMSFKLIFGNTSTEKYLFAFADKTLSLSATVLSKSQYCKNMGMKENETAYINCPSIFDKENRKTILSFAGSMAYKDKAGTMPKMKKKVETLLEKHSGQRGIIHTVNYEIAEYVIKNINTDRLIMPRGNERDKSIALFMESEKNDLVLISPSLQEGIDLKNDLSRFSIICKLPFANLADEWVKVRMNLDPIWYVEYTIATLIQMSGRSVRTESDHATTYILDSSFQWFFKQNMSKFPKWWTEAIYYDK